MKECSDMVEKDSLSVARGRYITLGPAIIKKALTEF